jgi:hypothetical protein
MPKLALALGTVLVVGTASIGFAGAAEGGADLSVPSIAEYYGIPSQAGAYGVRTVAPVAARTVRIRSGARNGR